LPTIFSVAKAGVEIDRAATTAITISLILILKLYRTDMKIFNKIGLFNQLFI
jgi:hypothetical protein